MPVADLAASYQEAIVDVLATKLVRACVETGAKSMMLAGGVAANRNLRERIRQLAPDNVAVYWPAMEFCTDNAAMIAGRAWHLARRDLFGGLDTDAFPKGAIAHVNS